MFSANFKHTDIWKHTFMLQRSKYFIKTKAHMLRWYSATDLPITHLRIKCVKNNVFNTNLLNRNAEWDLTVHQELTGLWKNGCYTPEWVRQLKMWKTMRALKREAISETLLYFDKTLWRLMNHELQHRGTSIWWIKSILCKSDEIPLKCKEPGYKVVKWRHFQEYSTA